MLNHSSSFDTIRYFVNYIFNNHRDLLGDHDSIQNVPKHFLEIARSFPKNSLPSSHLEGRLKNIHMDVKTNIDILVDETHGRKKRWTPMSYSFLVKFLMFSSLESFQAHFYSYLIEPRFLDKIKFLSPKNNFVGSKIGSPLDTILLWVNSSSIELTKSIIFFVEQNENVKSFLVRTTKSKITSLFRVVTISEDTSFLIINFGLFYCLKVISIFWIPETSPVLPYLILDSFERFLSLEIFDNLFLQSSEGKEFIIGLDIIKLQIGTDTLVRSVLMCNKLEAVPSWTPQGRIEFIPNPNATRRPTEPGKMASNVITDENQESARRRYESIVDLIVLHSSPDSTSNQLDKEEKKDIEDDKIPIGLAIVSYARMRKDLRYLIRYEEFETLHNILSEDLCSQEKYGNLPNDDNHWFYDSDYILMYRVLTILRELSHHYFVPVGKNEDWMELRVPLLELPNQHSSAYCAAMETFDAYKRFYINKHIIDTTNPKVHGFLDGDNVSNAISVVNLPEKRFSNFPDWYNPPPGNEANDLTFQYYDVLEYYKEIGDLTTIFPDTDSDISSQIARARRPDSITEALSGSPFNRAGPDPIEVQPMIGQIYGPMKKRSSLQPTEDVNNNDDDDDERQNKRLKLDESGNYTKNHTESVKQKIAVKQYINYMKKRASIQTEKQNRAKSNKIWTENQERSTISFVNWVESNFDNRSNESLRILVSNMDSWLISTFYRLLFDKRLCEIINPELKGKILRHFGRKNGGKIKQKRDYHRKIDSSVVPEFIQSSKDDGHFNQYFENRFSSYSIEERTIFQKVIKTFLIGDDPVVKKKMSAFNRKSKYGCMENDSQPKSYLYESDKRPNYGGANKNIYNKYTTNTFMAHASLIVCEMSIVDDFGKRIELPKWMINYLLVDFFQFKK